VSPANGQLSTLRCVALRATRGSSSLEDQTSSFLWRYAIVSCMPETTTPSVLMIELQCSSLTKTAGKEVHRLILYAIFIDFVITS